jgi:lauroyl/myristoyl acyltransferase
VPRIADAAGALASFIHRPGRKVAVEHLECASEASARPRRKQLVRQSYQHFTRAMADLFWSPRLTRENLGDIFDLEDVERLKREQGTERGVIFRVSALRGFEWIALALG